MKKLQSLLLLFPVLALGQSMDQNHTKSIIYRGAGATDPVSSVAYFDGLGRPVQSIAVGQSATGKDIVTHIEYDAYGRQAKEYLPYASASSSLAYRPDAATAIGSFYSTPSQQLMPGLEATVHPFSEKLFEASPLNRVLQQAAPGEIWALGSGHEIRMGYHSNSASDQVKIIRANAGALAGGYYPPTLVQGGTHAAGELYKTVTRDENWTSGNANTVEEFKDKEGRVVLKRTYGESIVGSALAFTKHDTYYAYDQYGNLTYVIPPLADGTLSAAVLDALCYQYRYDHRNRLVEKKLPGKQWEFIVYDRLDRVVATGPAQSPFSNLTGNGWLFTKYDAFSRPVLTGWLPATVTSAARNTLQAARNAQTTNLHAVKTATATNTTVNGVAFRYNNLSWPTGTAYHVLTVSYYDDYNFPDAPTAFGTVETQTVYYNATVKPKGLPTGSWVRVLESSADTRNDLSYTFYDSKARPIRTYTKNYLGGHTQADSRLDFSGKTLYTVTRHKRTASDTELYVKDSFTYTAQDRLESHVHQIGTGGIPQLLSKNSYNELGQLISKRVGGTDLSGNAPLQKADYAYNIRGWLKQINNPDNLLQSGAPKDLFAFRINYDTPANTSANMTGPFAVPLFNGNISETFWKTGSDSHLRSYGYGYDAMNRLRQAVYHYENEATNSYNEEMAYDKNGNIQSMLRNGAMDSQTQPQEIDDLAYTYHPQIKNRLMKVFDSSLSPEGFSDDSDGITDAEDDYAYDNFGNMTKDDNKGIASITYNHLNLPVKIIFGSEFQKIEYLYSADGRKLKKTVPYVDPNAVGGYGLTEMDYLGGFHYQDGALRFFPTAEGYVEKTLSVYSYVYNYTDHLGNIRLSYAQDPESPGTLKIIEESHYYPFGLKHKNYNSDEFAFRGQNEAVVLRAAAPANPVPVFNFAYKFNGQEFQDELGLNMYDMHFRDYDPAIGRWTGMDPVVHNSLSPYNGYDNNPVFWSDPSGADAVVTQNGVTFDGADAGAFYNALLGALGGNDTEFTLSGEIYDLSDSFGDSGEYTDIIVGSSGIVYDNIGSGSNYRIYDKTGARLHMNDYANDSQWLGMMKIGDRLYHSIDEKIFLEMIMEAGISSPFLRGPGRTAFESHSMADFGKNQIAPKFGIPYNKTEYDGVAGGDGSFFRFGNQKSIYNLADAGNFMWGAWMRGNSHSLWLTAWAADKNSRGTGNGPDTAADQRAIRNGHNYMGAYLTTLRNR